MGAGDREENCLLMMLIILFLISCQNLRRESWALKGSKQKGAGGGQEDSEGFVPWGTQVCTHGDVCTENPPPGALPGTGNAPKFRQQGPKSSLAPSRESWEVEGTGTTPWAIWAPSQLFVRAHPVTLGKAGKPGCCCALLRQDVSSHFTSALPLHLAESSACHTNN